MSQFQALLLAVVQGLTEFLPVSSSAHLAITGKLIGLADDKVPLDFVVAVHVGTLLSVLVFYRADLWKMARSLVGPVDDSAEARDECRHYRRLVLLLLVATVPAALAGMLLEDAVDRAFGSMALVGACLMVTAVLLTIASRMKGTGELAQTGLREALIVGVAQALALPPGISRSGATIFGGLVAGMGRDWAPRFAFLLSVPVITGGGLLELKHLLDGEASASFNGLLYGQAVVVAAACGYASILLVTDSVRRGNLVYFAAYCAAVGLAAMVWGG